MNYAGLYAGVSIRRRQASGGDTTAPTLVSAIVSNSTPGRIDLTWSESINIAVSASAAFAVSAGHALTAHTYVDATHSYLTTSANFTNGETARTLAYTQPGTNNMQDAVGNLLANFSGTSITNNVAAGGVIPSPPFAEDFIGASGSATFSWTASTTLADGSAIGTITDQKVRWGPNPGEQGIGGVSELAGRIASVAPGTLSKVIGSLSAGAWYARVTAINAAGEGNPSNEIGTIPNVS